MTAVIKVNGGTPLARPVGVGTGNGTHDQSQRQHRARDDCSVTNGPVRSHRGIGEKSLELCVARFLLVEEGIKTPCLGADVLWEEGGIEQLAQPWEADQPIGRRRIVEP